MDGFLNIHKPAGMTSHDVVARVRRSLKTKRVGHAGTLDPDATGVLVVAVGQATRLLPHVPLEPKVYLATIGFGTATDTEDASGQVTAQADASGLTPEALRAVLPRFVGEIQQVPPMVSALHHNGQRLYDLARQGITVEREARTITIHALELVAPPLLGAGGIIRVTCGGGTYIRTLCKDIGEALGLPAHMATLVREAVGPYALAEAIGLDEITEERLLPMQEALGWPTLRVSAHEAAELKLGRVIEGSTSGGECAALYQEGLVALVRWENGHWQPFKVFS
ncbi:tRNA pseudouridine(55) synthase TruB [Armatimonas sp.]|uniref:tRNA pseudouridine(55) synthase TruB n=1 Tax=Armatimonas sp. TaxID=1872638 RepID=UPI00374DF7A3